MTTRYTYLDRLDRRRMGLPAAGRMQDRDSRNMKLADGILLILSVAVAAGVAGVMARPEFALWIAQARQSLGL
jgi:hypothetical protein